MRSAQIVVLLVALVAFASSSPEGARAGADCTPAGMARIPAGTYSPLFRAEGDSTKVNVAAFYLDILPVTNGDFLEFVRRNPRWRRSRIPRLFADSEYLKLWAGDLELGTACRSNAPVTYISWFAAKAYAGWKQKRLPATAEWEYT